MQIQSVACSACGRELRVATLAIGYFVLPRQCRHCSAYNLVVTEGARAEATPLGRRRPRSHTAEIPITRPVDPIG